MKVYIPKPIETNRIKLPSNLFELTELLARNTHEVWAKQRISEGWEQGSKRDDTQKLHPCLIPYEDLPENEKEYDRNTAMETLKVILKLGFDITKRNIGQ